MVDLTIMAATYVALQHNAQHLLSRIEAEREDGTFASASVQLKNGRRARLLQIVHKQFTAASCHGDHQRPGRGPAGSIEITCIRLQRQNWLFLNNKLYTLIRHINQ